MKTKPSWIQEKEMKLPSGATVLWQYDTESDVLELFFAHEAASGTVELANGVFLRFDRQSKQPLSLAITAYSHLQRRGEFGTPLLALDGVQSLPPAERAVVIAMLQTSPLRDVLTMYSFQVATQTQATPVALLAERLPQAA